MAGDVSRHAACLQCTQNCYRTHGTGNFNGSCFFKIMLNGFHTQLRFPPKFVDQMNDLIGPDVILEGPSGQLWHAKLCRIDSEVTIEDGWERFVLDHAIEIGDILVFKHAGKSHFIVQIFGRSGCEKQIHFKVDIRDKMMEDLIEMSDTNSCDVSIGCDKQVEKMHRSFRARKGSTTDKCLKALNYARVSGNRKVRYIKSQRKGDKCRASGHSGTLKEALSLKTRKPIFLITMRKSAVNDQCRLNFPLEFSRRWLPKDGTKVTLLGPDTKKWATKYPGWNWNSHRRFLSGWRHFVLTYDLKQGDICVFELLDKKIFTFKVHIFRAKDCMQKTKVMKANKSKQ